MTYPGNLSHEQFLDRLSVLYASDKEFVRFKQECRTFFRETDEAAALAWATKAINAWNFTNEEVQAGYETEATSSFLEWFRQEMLTHGTG